MSQDVTKKKIINRLRTIKGHVQGIEKMIEEDACCDDLLVQIAAVKQSIHKVGLVIMEEQASQCFFQDQEMPTEQEEKMKKLMKTLFNYTK